MLVLCNTTSYNFACLLLDVLWIEDYSMFALSVSLSFFFFLRNTLSVSISLRSRFRFVPSWLDARYFNITCVRMDHEYIYNREHYEDIVESKRKKIAGRISYCMSLILATKYARVSQ
jgi:hypothetical protein